MVSWIHKTLCFELGFCRLLTKSKYFSIIFLFSLLEWWNRIKWVTCTKWLKITEQKNTKKNANYSKSEEKNVEHQLTSNRIEKDDWRLLNRIRSRNLGQKCVFRHTMNFGERLAYWFPYLSQSWYASMICFYHFSILMKRRADSTR